MTADDAAGGQARLEKQVVAVLKPLGTMLSSDILIAWAGKDRVFHGWSFDRVPESAESILASVQLSPQAGGAIDPPEVLLSVRTAGGDRVFSSELETTVTDRRVSASGEISLDGVPAGRYEVRFDIRSGGIAVGTVSKSITIAASH
jgi:hypothetical protein